MAAAPPAAALRRLQDRAWSYPYPYDGAAERVGKDFADYVAFWKDVRVTE